MDSLISFAKSLREKSTNTENDFWYYLRAKRFCGGNYIVDFVCLEKRVIIELDGSQHFEQQVKDKRRDEWLKKEGYAVLRFWDHEFYQNREEVLESIRRCCNVSPSP